MLPGACFETHRFAMLLSMTPIVDVLDKLDVRLPPQLIPSACM
jgi:hypothetical protein